MQYVANLARHLEHLEPQMLKYLSRLFASVPVETKAKIDGRNQYNHSKEAKKTCHYEHSVLKADTLEEGLAVDQHQVPMHCLRVCYDRNDHNQPSQTLEYLKLIILNYTDGPVTSHSPKRRPVFYRV